MALSTSLQSLAAAQKSSRGVPAYTLHVNRPLGPDRRRGGARAPADPTRSPPSAGCCRWPGSSSSRWSSPRSAPASRRRRCSPWAMSSTRPTASWPGCSGRWARGEWYDHVIDCAKTVALHGALLISTYRFVADPPASHLLLPLGFQLVGVVLFFSTLLAEQLLRARDGAVPPAPGARCGRS